MLLAKSTGIGLGKALATGTEGMVKIATDVDDYDAEKYTEEAMTSRALVGQKKLIWMHIIKDFEPKIEQKIVDVYKRWHDVHSDACLWLDTVKQFSHDALLHCARVHPERRQ